MVRRPRNTQLYYGQAAQKHIVVLQLGGPGTHCCTTVRLKSKLQFIAGQFILIQYKYKASQTISKVSSKLQQLYNYHYYKYHLGQVIFNYWDKGANKQEMGIFPHLRNHLKSCQYQRETTLKKLSVFKIKNNIKYIYNRELR